MSTNRSTALEVDETAQNRARAEQFSFDVDAPGLIQVTSESHENPVDHQYVVIIDVVTGDQVTCTCPHPVHRTASCKPMAAVENATDDGMLDAFPPGDNEDSFRRTCYDDVFERIWVRVFVQRERGLATCWLNHVNEFVDDTRN